MSKAFESCVLVFFFTSSIVDFRWLRFVFISATATFVDHTQPNNGITIVPRIIVKTFQTKSLVRGEDELCSWVGKTNSYMATNRNTQLYI